MRIVEAQASTWNTRFVVELSAGEQVEAVLYRGDTLCISSQVGCAVRCPFCASGANGLGRNLSFDELVRQVELVRATGASIARTTVSGVGEPLHNLDNVARFLEHAHKARIPASLTTSGGNAERLRTALGWLHNGLTISVHAGTEQTREKLVPKGPTLGVIFDALYERVPALTRRRRHKTALAYLVMHGENDGDDEIDAFIERARPLPLFVNLYAHNAVPTSGMRGSPRERFEQVYERMTNAGLTVRMSSQARIEDNGGCGTLVALRKKREAAAH